MRMTTPKLSAEQLVRIERTLKLGQPTTSQQQSAPPPQSRRPVRPDEAKEHDRDYYWNLVDYRELQRKASRGLPVDVGEIAYLASVIAYAEKIYAKDEWPRYFRRHAGVIHGRQSCTTVKPTNARPDPPPQSHIPELMPELSGMSVSHVARRGLRMCHRCFPQGGEL